MQILDLGIIESALRTLAAFFCKFIYQIIGWIYELFITIARVNILSSEDIAPIYQRVTMILTIVMVFYITFEFVKYVVQPDTINDKEKGVGNMALKIIVVILLIAFVPKIFTMAYDLQGRIIDNQLFSKVILGKKEVNMSTYGRGFSADMFSVFYKVNEEACKGCDSEGVVNFNLNRLRTTGDLKYLTAGLNESVSMLNPATQKNEDTPIIDFDGLFAIVVGAVLIYILALYCIDVGTRYAQLIFLQIISPIAIMGYLTPKKDSMFSKWVKQCVTTYLNLFIRIAIIYFVLLICQVLGESYGNGKLFEGLGTISPSIQAFTYIALVMGLLIFASKAPKMLQELFPSSGAAGIGFGLRTPSQVVKDAPYLGRAIGAAYAGGGSMLKNTRKSFGKAIEEFKKGGKDHRKKALKWLARGTLGNVGAGLSGIGLGLGSTDPSGWQRAMKNSYDRRQAKYKIHDAGYAPIGKGASKWWSDQARNILLMDEHIEDMTKASDLRVQGIQQRINVMQQDKKFKSDITVFKSKVTDEYIVYDKEGKEMARSKNITGLPTQYQYNAEIAELNSQLGSEEAKNKALHQKENESKDKK